MKYLIIIVIFLYAAFSKAQTGSGIAYKDTIPTTAPLDKETKILFSRFDNNLYAWNNTYYEQIMKFRRVSSLTTDIYRLLGNTGLGVSSPISKLHILGGARPLTLEAGSTSLGSFIGFYYGGIYRLSVGMADLAGSSGSNFDFNVFSDVLDKRLLTIDGNNTYVGIGNHPSNTLAAYQLEVFGTGDMKPPTGTTAQRSSNKVDGLFRYNTTLDRFEGVRDTTYQSFAFLVDLIAQSIASTPSGNLAATTVQSALNELQTDVDTRALDNAVVKLTGAQTVAGVKTFSSSPIVPTATTSTQAVNLAQVENLTGKASVFSTTDTTEVPINSSRALGHLQIVFNDLAGIIEGDTVINLVNNGRYQIDYSITTYGDVGVAPCNIIHTISNHSGTMTTVLQIHEESGIIANSKTIKGSFFVQMATGTPKIKILVNNQSSSTEKLILDGAQINIKKLYN